MLFEDDFEETPFRNHKKKLKTKKSRSFVEKYLRECPSKHPSKYLLKYLSKYILKVVIRYRLL